MGNVRRGQLYPLCVGAERVMQAQTIAHMARKLGTNMIAHGCTAAGNDQVRFEVALRTLAPELEVLAPVRDRAFKRSEELEYLQQPRAAGAAVRRGLLDQPRALGRHHRRQGDADLVRQHSRMSAWVLTRDAFTQPRAAGAPRHRASSSGRPGRRSMAASTRPGRADRGARGARRRRSASAAASIWATPSSAPRDAWRSRRPRPRCC